MAPAPLSFKTRGGEGGGGGWGVSHTRTEPGRPPPPWVCTCGTEITSPWQWACAGLDWGVSADYRCTTPPEIEE